MHVCNWSGTSPRIPLLLHRAIALPIGRVRRAVLTPVVRMTSAPVRLRPRLVIAVVGVDAKSPPLPTASAFPLTCRGRAVSLIGDPQKGWNGSPQARQSRGDFMMAPEPHSSQSGPVMKRSLIRVALKRYYFGAKAGQSQELCRTQQDVFGAAPRKPWIFRMRRRINCGALRHSHDLIHKHQRALLTVTTYTHTKIIRTKGSAHRPPANHSPLHRPPPNFAEFRYHLE